MRDSWKLCFTYLRQNERFLFLVTNNGFSTLGARGFSCAVSGFGQVLKSDLRGFAPRRTREKTAGSQGTVFPKLGKERL